MKPSKNFPYKTGDEGYNRKSGRKTLVLVGICICLITVFSTLAVITLLSE